MKHMLKIKRMPLLVHLGIIIGASVWMMTITPFIGGPIYVVVFFALHIVLQDHVWRHATVPFIALMAVFALYFTGVFLGYYHVLREARIPGRVIR